MKIMNTFRSLKSDDKGATLVEYGIAITLAVGLGLGALAALAQGVGNKMGDAEAILDADTPIVVTQ